MFAVSLEEWYKFSRNSFCLAFPLRFEALQRERAVFPATHLRRLFFVLLLRRRTQNIVKHKLLPAGIKGGFHPHCRRGCLMVGTLKVNSWRFPKTLVLSSLEVIKFNPKDTCNQAAMSINHSTAMCLSFPSYQK